jgi:phosphoserine phosphatase
MSNRVFVSSTFKDLEEYRKAVLDAIRQLGAVDVAMEHFGAREERPLAECLRLIADESDIFVGIYAHRYGFVPDGEANSISEAEYDTASTKRKPRLIYLVDETIPWVPAYIDQGQAKDKLDAFKGMLRKNHICGSFRSKDELAAKVAADLGRFLSEGTLPSSIGHRGVLHEPEPAWLSPLSKNHWRYKTVAFDLDGTLLRGENFQFSWELVWSGLGFSRGIQSDLKRAYRRSVQENPGDAERIQAYREWCQKACDYFVSRNLTRDQLSGIAKPLSLTKNLLPALTRLRREGFVVGIISGGINCFLEDKLPDFREWFDFVFINELTFDRGGNLEGVIATEYDFEGKAKALQHMCKRARCTEDEAVFVGDGFNDETIMLAACMSIAYPPKDQAVKGVSQTHIAEDNLELVVPYICVE